MNLRQSDYTGRIYYSHLKKPSWAPPAKVFGPVWTLLYILIAISFGAVVYRIYRGSIPAAVIWPIGLNLLSNFAYTPIEFGLENNYLALADVLLVLLTLIWSMVEIYPYLAWAVYLLVPYLVWVSFATVLQAAITYLNR